MESPADLKGPDMENFIFRDLHPHVFVGTASDRYAGWLGQVYSAERFGDRVSERVKTIGGKAVKERVLPVECVEEYFQHFSVLELDFTFYAPLLEKDMGPGKNYHLLQRYRECAGRDGRFILKVPQVVFAQRLWKGTGFLANPDYLNPEVFARRFYEPATRVLGDLLTGLVFEQEYQPKSERSDAHQFAEALDRFLGAVPGDPRYHLEVRTESLLSSEYFEVLERHGVGQVLSHWTWLPSLERQFERGGRRFLNGGRQCVVRLMTPLRMRYEEAYLKAYPFDRLVEGMLSPRMVGETAQLMVAAVGSGVSINVIVNNRAGGNAPLTAQKISGRFLELLG